MENNEQVQRLVASLGQDILRGVTKGQWKLPKHILICMALRHLFRSKHLVTLINRLGHCDTYRFTLELETSIARSMDECSTLLSPDIVLNSMAPEVFHSEFDNFAIFLNTMEGKAFEHTALGIMLQEVGDRQGSRHQLQSSRVPKLDSRLFKLLNQRFLIATWLQEKVQTTHALRKQCLAERKKLRGQRKSILCGSYAGCMLL